jgi:hypothetical protein
LILVHAERRIAADFARATGLTLHHRWAGSCIDARSQWENYEFSMKNDQYTVLLDSRPLRVAFLLDIEKFQPRSDRFFALVCALVRCNNIQWGGRTNPIIFYTGESLSDKDWQLIEATDPDRILAFAPLPVQIDGGIGIPLRYKKLGNTHLTASPK